MPTPSVYPSKVDALPVVLIGFTLIAVAGGAVVAFAEGTANGDIGGWIALGTLGFIGVVVAGLAWPVEYTLRAEGLEIRTGFLRWVVAYDSIRGIREEKTWMSGPTLSYDRWRIDYEQDEVARFVWVSPKDKQGFRKALEALLPNGEMS